MSNNNHFFSGWRNEAVYLSSFPNCVRPSWSRCVSKHLRQRIRSLRIRFQPQRESSASDLQRIWCFRRQGTHIFVIFLYCTKSYSILTVSFSPFFVFAWQELDYKEFRMFAMACIDKQREHDRITQKKKIRGQIEVHVTPSICTVLLRRIYVLPGTCWWIHAVRSIPSDSARLPLLVGAIPAHGQPSPENHYERRGRRRLRAARQEGGVTLRRALTRTDTCRLTVAKNNMSQVFLVTQISINECKFVSSDWTAE